MSAAVWWNASGNIGYLGLAPKDGLDWRRHCPTCPPGLWAVGITGWLTRACTAVIDDFGNLVQVPSPEGWQ